MFNVLLYAWAIITVILVGMILYFCINRIRQLKHKEPVKEDTIPLSEEQIAQTMQEEISEITYDEDMDSVQSQEDDAIQDIAEPIDTLVVESIVITATNDEPENDSIEESVDESIAISPEKTDEPEQQLPDTDTANDETHTQEIANQSVDAKNYDYLFVGGVEGPEIPKDLDASRNIAQGHSRDDIVRDKFEKHIQKIRYEIGILKQRNDILGYEKKLVEGITLLPNDIDFQKQLADLYFHQGKYKKAQSLLKKILLDNPSDHYALWQVGEIASVEGNTEDAYLYLQQAYAACDDNPKYCFSLAQRYYDHDALEQALPLMEKMVKLRPKNIDYLVSLSHVQYKIGMLDDAKQSLLRALELDPMNITLKNYLKAFT